ncbi:hypothetical protein GF337_17650, partial [candidate division KSB1 bacterium]|nr:hypothetical protein [candidate division KSB1 bacterium]
MIKKFTLVVLTLLCATSMVLAQEVTVMPYGISPTDVKADTVGNPDYVGIFDRPYNGLLNVGVETQMYFKGMSDAALVNPLWTVAQKPDGSIADFYTPVSTDSNVQFVAFTPDVMGTYVIEFSDGGDPASLTINAGLYLGVEDGRCTLCHSGVGEEWMMTGHADMLERGLNGEIGSFYRESCLECHTVGYDTFANNDGFDDFDFVFPDTLFDGQYQNMVDMYPDAMKRANIQCESCHGPGSEHNGVVEDNKMVVSLSTSNCAVCHDDDHYHVYPSQWEGAGHANLPPYPAGNRTDCGGCHNGAQFIQFASGEPITQQPPVDVTCAVCHDPHSAENPDQLRIMMATLSNDEAVMDAGKGALCMNCHQSRRNALTYTNSPRPHYGPHYAPQADILIGTNAVTFGKKLPTSAHLASTDDACVDCHMHEKGDHGEHDDDGNLTTAGMHSFSMVSKDGVDNVFACQGCHGDVGESFEEKKFFMNGNADHDGDGEEEGLQAEVHGLMDELGSMLPDADPHADVDSTWTRTELKAAFNHRLIYYDHSYGIHNPAYTVSLLKVTIQALMNNALEGEIVAIQDIPNDQGKQVWIIWDKFVDDGVSADPVETYIVKRNDAEGVWVGVGEHTADASMRYALVVPTLFDSTIVDGMHETTFKVVAVTRGGMVHESMPAQGYSVDNLIPQAPSSVIALASGSNVELTWEAPEDPDVNYYRIFRSTSADFVADETTQIGTTIDLEFVDDAAETGT